jgi:hypothetical protein
MHWSVGAIRRIDFLALLHEAPEDPRRLFEPLMFYLQNSTSRVGDAGIGSKTFSSGVLYLTYQVA